MSVELSIYEQLVITILYIMYLVSALIMGRNTSLKIKEIDNYLEVSSLGAVENAIDTAITIRRLSVIRLVHTMIAPLILMLTLFVDAHIAVKILNVVVLVGICAMNFTDTLQALEFANKIEALMDLKRDLLQQLARSEK